MYYGIAQQLSILKVISLSFLFYGTTVCVEHGFVQAEPHVCKWCQIRIFIRPCQTSFAQWINLKKQNNSTTLNVPLPPVTAPVLY